MKNWYLPSADSPILEWLGFIAFLLLLCVCLGAFIIWLRMAKSHKVKHNKHHKHRHHRPINPTLAQTGGLPPKRDPNTPPPGP
jgi:ABC-type nickel/cobalt efflux system permease component RcnA